MSKTQDKARAGMLAGVTAGHAQSEIDRRMAADADRGRAVALLGAAAVHSRAAGDTRPPRAEHVLAVAESVGAVGLLVPLAVDRAGHLVAGLHRLEACRLLLAQPADREGLWLALAGADRVPEWQERLGALPAPDELAEPLRAGLLPVRRLDLDSVKDPDAALAAEAAENTARRAYTRAEVGSLVERLRAAGYRETGGRPRKGERALRPALELVLGISRNTARRMLGTLEEPGKVAQVGTFSGVLKAADRLDRAARAYLVAIEELPEGVRVPRTRDLARESRVLLRLAEGALDELRNLEGDE